MNTVPSASPSSVRPATIVWAGMFALAVAMGIGRFAFTPLLPLMLAEHSVDLPSASWLASANYAGYLLGALLCTAQPTLSSLWKMPPVDGARFVRAGLVATTLLTLGMALPVGALWPLLRFLAGMASAVVFVYTSGWCLARLTSLGVPGLGGAIYAGPGVGIAVSGLLVGALSPVGLNAAAGWSVFGLLAAVLTAVVWRTVRGSPAAAAAAGAAPPAAPRRVAGVAHKGTFAVAYGLSGFGYIITATYLPVIAAETLPPSGWLSLFWPLLGGGVIVGALLATRLPGRVDFRDALAACYLVQGLGVVLGVWVPGIGSFAVGSLLVGLPFTAISFFGMQEARRLSPAAPAALMGLSTAMYGLGQMVGPPLAAQLIASSGNRTDGFAWALHAAALSLVLGAAMLLALARLRPRPSLCRPGS